MDEKVEVETPFGPIWLRGRDTGRPAVVLIHGAFSAPEPVARVRADGLDFFVAHLPGNHCPDLSATNIGVWGAAYRYAVEHGLGGRDHVVVGVSTGALIALAMRSRGLRQLVLAEPPLWPAEIWPLRSFPGETPAWGDEMLWQVFGVGHGRFEPRDYRHLIETITAPTIAIVGGDPLLPERPCDRLPSFVGEATRAALAAHPLIDLRIATGAGHNVPRDGFNVFAPALTEAATALLTPAR